MDTLSPPTDARRFEAEQLILESPDDFRVHGSVYTSEDIFRAEMNDVFGKCWVFVGHESEIAQPGDFKTSYIGLRPVVLSRDEDGGINVFLNRCRHRGSALCREEAGSVKRFQCPYHGWVYGLDGSLQGIAKHKGGYPDDIDKSQLGLMRVPRMENYRGMIFCNMDPDAIPFLDYLGEAKPFLDTHLDRSPTGEVEVVHGAHRTEYRGNWKFQAENSTDGYHGDIVHESFFKLVAEFGNKGGQHGAYTQGDLDEIFAHRMTGRTLGFENGHGIWESPLTPDAAENLKRGPFKDYVDWLEDAYGTQRMHEMLNSMNLLIFPSIAILHGQFRVIRPISVDRTEVAIHFFKLKGASEAYNDFRLSGYQRFFGPASFGSPDDVEIFAFNQTGLQAEEVEWLLLSRGMGRETADDQGVRVAESTDETPQRSFHRAWKERMGAA
jgi:benzoate/toluate 1,2-dioxygenase alpha subunit